MFVKTSKTLPEKIKKIFRPCFWCSCGIAKKMIRDHRSSSELRAHYQYSFYCQDALGDQDTFGFFKKPIIHFLK